MEKKAPKTYVLYLSIAIIIVSWIVTSLGTVLFPEASSLVGRTVPSLFRSALASKAIVIAVILGLLWLGKERFEELGFRKQHLAKQVFIGVLAALFIFLIDTILLGSIMASILPESSLSQETDQSALFNDLSYLPLWILMAVFFGGFTEELQRIFVLTRFERGFGKAGLVLALLASSVVFGLAHLYQGASSAVSSVISGLLYALVYLRKRSAVEAIACHAFYDLVAITLGYLTYYGK